MSHAERTDAELLRLARQGSASAFAVLYARRAPAVLRQIPGHGTDGLVRVFTHLLRHLDEVPSPAALDDHLSARTSAISRHRPRRATDDTDRAGAALDDDAVLDRAWERISASWPQGRPRRHVPQAVTTTGFVLLLVATGFVLPYVFLGVEMDDTERERLVARPYTEHPDTDPDGDAGPDDPADPADPPELPPLPAPDADGVRGSHPGVGEGPTRPGPVT